MNKEHNIRLITLDSCRYDTAVKANTPNLDNMSSLKKAENYATFTFPAHHAFFIGNLPMIEGEDKQYIAGIDQIWRSTDARNTDKKVLSTFDSINIIDYYQRNGYNVQGFGGVGFFNTFVSSNSLPSLFKNFQYFGPESNLHPYEKLPRHENTLPLGNIDVLVDKISDREPYFLFVNCPETHIPYDVPGTNVDAQYIDLIKRVYKEQNKKVRHDPNNLPFTDAEIDQLKNQQTLALEWVDGKLGELFAELPANLPTVTIVLGDHGEEFGDEGRFGHVHTAKSILTVPVWVGYTEK